MHPSIGVSEEYSDNFFQAAENKEDNFRTAVTPGLSLLINSALIQGQLEYRPSFNHDTIDDELSVSHAFTGLATWQATPLFSVRASDVLTHGDDPEQANQLGLRRQRRSYTANTFSLDAEYVGATLAPSAYYRFATFFQEDGEDTIAHTIGVATALTLYQVNSLSLAYEYSMSGTSDGGADVDGHRVSASLRRQFGAFSSGGLAASYAWRTESRGSEDDDFTIATVYAFAAYALPRQWSVGGSVGYTYLTQDRGSDEGSVFASLAVSAPLGRGAVTLAGEIGFSESYASGENLGVVKTRGVTARVTYPLLPDLTVGAGGSYRENDFTGVAGGDEGREDKTWEGRVSVSYQLLRWLGLSAEYTYTDAQSSRREDEFTENRVLLSLTATF